MGIIAARKEERGHAFFKQKQKTTELFERRKKLLPNALAILNPSSVMTAHGALVTDADGNELIDFAGGIGVLNAGHMPDTVVKAIQEQAAKFIHTCFNVAIY